MVKILSNFQLRMYTILDSGGMTTQCFQNLTTRTVGNTFYYATHTHTHIYIKYYKSLPFLFATQASSILLCSLSLSQSLSF